MHFASPPPRRISSNAKLRHEAAKPKQQQTAEFTRFISTIVLERASSFKAPILKWREREARGVRRERAGQKRSCSARRRASGAARVHAPDAHRGRRRTTSRALSRVVCHPPRLALFLSWRCISLAKSSRANYHRGPVRAPRNSLWARAAHFLAFSSPLLLCCSLLLF